MPRSRLLTRIRSSIAVNTEDAHSEELDIDLETVLTDEISLYDTDFEDIDTDSLPAQDPNAKRDSESTKVAPSAHNSCCKVDADVDASSKQKEKEVQKSDKDEALCGLAALAAKARRQRFREDANDVEAEVECTPELSTPKGPSSSAHSVRVDAELEQELQLERVKSWVTFTFEPEESTETPPALPPKDRTPAEIGVGVKNGKLKRVFKRLFCIGSELVSAENLSRVQLPLTQNGVIANSGQPPSLGLSLALAFSGPQPSRAQEAQDIHIERPGYATARARGTMTRPRIAHIENF